MCEQCSGKQDDADPERLNQSSIVSVTSSNDTGVLQNGKQDGYAIIITVTY